MFDKSGREPDDPEIGLAPYHGRHQRKFCSICGEKFYSLNLCKRHYIRLKRHNNPLTVIAMPDRKHARLDPQKAAEIRKLREAGFTLKAIADDYDVHLSTVGKITTGVCWRDAS